MKSEIERTIENFLVAVGNQEMELAVEYYRELEDIAYSSDTRPKMNTAQAIACAIVQCPVFIRFDNIAYARHINEYGVDLRPVSAWGHADYGNWALYLCDGKKFTAHVRHGDKAALRIVTMANACRQHIVNQLKALSN